MSLRYSWILCAFILSACNMSVTSLTASPSPAVESSEPTPAPFPDTPAPEAVNSSPVESPPLIEFEFFSELDGWGVTETKIVRTNDGGITWYDVTPPDVESIGEALETFFLDNNHVWLQKPDFNNFPNNGLLYRTADGGLTWSISSTPFSSGDLSFVDAGHGWMLADLGVGAGSNAVAVFQTTDGGATWTKTYTNDPNDSEAGDSLPLGGLKSDLVPLDMRTAWVGGVVYSPGTVYLFRTDDGGQTWSPVDLDLPDGAADLELSINEGQMEMMPEGAGFLALSMTGDAPQTVLYRTTDAGSSWTRTPTQIPSSGEADFLSADEVVIYNGEQFYVTRDAGTTWATISPDLNFGEAFGTMDFVNPLSGWVVTVDPTTRRRSLFRTHDGGATWLPVSP